MTHNKLILSHIKTFKTITPMEALKFFGCYRLAARIFDLREAGHKITTTRFETETGSRPAKYVYLGKAK